MTKELQVTAALVRALYPEVNASNEDTEDEGYCVMGALAQWFDPDTPMKFPHYAMSGAYNMMRANPTLTYRQAVRWARTVQLRNDAHDFDRAWRTLDKALRYRGDGA